MHRILESRNVGCGDGKKYDWNGLEAAYIISKRQNAKEEEHPPNGYDPKFPPEDIPRIENKASECRPIWYKANAEWFKSTAELVADATERVNTHIGWHLIPAETCDLLRDKVICSIIRLVLSILDWDDIGNTKPNQKIREYERLLQSLDFLFKSSGCSWEDSAAMPYKQSLKSKRRKMAMLGIAEERLGAESFVGLNEADVGCLISALMGWSKSDVRCWNTSSYLASSKGKYAKQVHREMETFVPLKAEFKVQLNMEILHERSFRIYDWLFVEVCKQFVSLKLLNDLKSHLVGSSDTAEHRLSCFLHTVYSGVVQLLKFKRGMLGCFRGAFFGPLGTREPFGFFDGEIKRVFAVADQERRMRCQPFIGLHGILLGLSLSRVGDLHLVKSEISNSSPDKPAEMPPFKIYKWTRDCAQYFKAEVTGLEHLALAVLAVKKGDRSILYNTQYLQELEDEKNKWSFVHEKADAVKRADLKYLNEPILYYETLIRAITSGGGLDLLKELRC